MVQTSRGARRKRNARLPPTNIRRRQFFARRPALRRRPLQGLHLHATLIGLLPPGQHVTGDPERHRVRSSAHHRADDFDPLGVEVRRRFGEQANRLLSIFAVHGGDQRVPLFRFGQAAGREVEKVAIERVGQRDVDLEFLAPAFLPRVNGRPGAARLFRGAPAQSAVSKRLSARHATATGSSRRRNSPRLSDVKPAMTSRRKIVRSMRGRASSRRTAKKPSP